MATATRLYSVLTVSHTGRAAGKGIVDRPRDLLSTTTMEAPLHQYYPVPPPLQDASSSLLQQAVAARALMMSTAGNKLQAPPSSSAATSPGREQCPRCASRDTKFCYYNNYNTAQPRHFCRSCRRYWTLGGSLRNVPVGGSTRKRPRHARAAAVTATRTAATTAASAGGSPFASPPATLHGGLFLRSLLLAGSVSASASAASPLLALGAAPLLEGRLGFDLDLGLGDAAALACVGGAAAADVAPHHPQQLPLPWPAATAPILEGDRTETTTTTWKDVSIVFPFPTAAALWQELAVAAPALHHGSTPHLLL